LDNCAERAKGGENLILFLIALLSATTAVQGDVINLTLTEPAQVVLDECMYFESTLTSAANLSAGEYMIKITHSCYGSHFIEIKSAKGLETIQVNVGEDNNPENSLVEMDNQILNLKKKILQLENRNSYLQNLVETLNNINVELYDRTKEYAEENKDLRSRVNELSLMAENCSKVVEDLKATLKSKNETLTFLENENVQLKAQIDSLNQSLTAANTYSEIFRTLFFTTLAFLVGLLFAILRR